MNTNAIKEILYQNLEFLFEKLDKCNKDLEEIEKNESTPI